MRGHRWYSCGLPKVASQSLSFAKSLPVACWADAFNPIDMTAWASKSNGNALRGVGSVPQRVLNLSKAGMKAQCRRGERFVFRKKGWRPGRPFRYLHEPSWTYSCSTGKFPDAIPLQLRRCICCGCRIHNLLQQAQGGPVLPSWAEFEVSNKKWK